MFQTDETSVAGTHAAAAWPSPMPEPEPGGPELRQLRHHMKNALQRICVLVSTFPGLNASAEGRRLAQEVERRICLTAQVSDALFGLTQAPGSLERRLRWLSEGLVRLLADDDQVIDVEVTCHGTCPTSLEEVVVRVTQELVGNALKHGFYARLLGVVRLDLACGPGGVTLVVADDGWGFEPRNAGGQGLNLVRALIAPFGGVLSVLPAQGCRAEVRLPWVAQAPQRQPL